MTAKQLKIIRAAVAKVNQEIAFNSEGGKYARGTASEGYAGGYVQALRDVLLLMESGTMPNTRGYWGDD